MSSENSRHEEQPVSSTGRSADEVEDNHPAFGVAVVTRSSGSSRSLFQSDVLHSESVTLSIQRATRVRALNHDWVHPHQTLVEVEMSLAQWGALVSSIGIGSGVPVTIRRTETEVFVPTLPYQPRLKASLDEVHGSISKLFARAKETLAAVEAAVEGKKGVRAIRDALRAHGNVINHASSNSEFAVRSMTEAGEKVTSQVRADIEAQILASSRLVGQHNPISAPEIRLDAIEPAPTTNGAPS